MNNNSNPEAQEAVLKIRTDGQNRRFILVADELMTIGRGSSCAIQIQDQSVSRKHCVAVFSKGKVCINDLYSTHGLSLNGQRVDRCELMPGESCKLGHAIATFEAPATPTPKEIPKSKMITTATDSRHEAHSRTEQLIWRPDPRLMSHGDIQGKGI